LEKSRTSLTRPQKRLGRGLHQFPIFPLIGQQLGFQRQPGHTENPVQRRTDFVRHVGQKFALGRAERLGTVGHFARQAARFLQIVIGLGQFAVRCFGRLLGAGQLLGVAL
jgi:hypothetical protein